MTRKYHEQNSQPGAHGRHNNGGDMSQYWRTQSPREKKAPPKVSPPKGEIVRAWCRCVGVKSASIGNAPLPTMELAPKGHGVIGGGIAPIGIWAVNYDYDLSGFEELNNQLQKAPAYMALRQTDGVTPKPFLQLGPWRDKEEKVVFETVNGLYLLAWPASWYLLSSNMRMDSVLKGAKFNLGVFVARFDLFLREEKGTSQTGWEDEHGRPFVGLAWEFAKRVGEGEKDSREKIAAVTLQQYAGAQTLPVFETFEGDDLPVLADKEEDLGDDDFAEEDLGDEDVNDELDIKLEPDEDLDNDTSGEGEADEAEPES